MLRHRLSSSLAAGVLLLLPVSLLLRAQPTAEHRRNQMVREQIEARGIRDARVLAALRETPRHLYVPDAMREQAYEDHPLPIGHNQTISQPYIVAYMSELLALTRSDRVLEIGTGSGYQAAILGRLAGQVFSIEIVEQLAVSARRLLTTQGIRNVRVRHGDGYAGWPEEAPFDRVILTAAPPEIPQALLDQLRPGGRLVAPVGREGRNQMLLLVEKEADGTIRRRSVLPVAFVPMVRK